VALKDIRLANRRRPITEAELDGAPNWLRAPYGFPPKKGKDES
jgi:hypothetical protein